MKNSLIFNVIIFTLFLSLQVSGQGYLKVDGKVIVNENGDTILLRGMGLGGWMLQEGYMLQTSGFANAQYQIRDKIEQLIGMTDTDLFYEAWLNNHVRKIDIDSLKAWGFNSVRLPMHYKLFTLPVEEEPVAGQNTWLTKGFELTDSLISWCKQNEMYVILDLHAAPGGQGYDQGISDYNPDKPSLWESQANRDKTVDLWEKLAQRYADEPWVGGYDLINETNWNMAGNTPLRDLYYEITDSIRRVDTNHILFIEGNWFANDFTGLTPPWDDNIVYSPHKYWSTNDQNSIQWVLNIRETHNVPLYFGESGENSNVWFRDAIKLFEDHGIGWAWWPMKKIESISGPLSVPKSPEYQTLLDYWNGNAPQPAAGFAKSALMQMAEGLKLENCVFHKDVIDAMFRQVYSDEAVPYNIQDIPGVIYSTDFDMGVLGSAYYDIDVANYQVSTGNYTSWNNGWVYRNDAVDLETSMDDTNTNGYHVGWLSTGEWMQYSVNVAADAVYDIKVRVASIGTEGRFHFQSGTADISLGTNVPNTGDWQNWQTITVPNIVLSPSDNKIRFFVDNEGFNVGSFNFTQKGSTTDLNTYFLSGITLDDHTVQINISKPLAGPLPASPAGFEIKVNGNPISITNTVLNPDNTRMITFAVNTAFKSSDVIKITYSGNQIQATDGVVLNTFFNKLIQNTVATIHAVPGKVEAEDYFYQLGIQLENTTDTGGGQNISYLDAGDYADYYISVSQAGLYKVDYRTAALSETGAIKMELIAPSGNAGQLHEISFASTGGWQNWVTTSKNLILPVGLHHIRMTITQPLFNINWFEFTFLTGRNDKQFDQIKDLALFPNPTNDFFVLQGTLVERQDVEIRLHNLFGQKIFERSLKNVESLQEHFDLNDQPNGTYFVMIRMENGAIRIEKLVKTGN